MMQKVIPGIFLWMWDVPKQCSTELVGHEDVVLLRPCSARDSLGDHSSVWRDAVLCWKSNQGRGASSVCNNR